MLLMAAKFGVPVCPHAGGVGLCEYVQHLSIFDYICVSASLENRMLEYVDHLHEHFVDPVVIRNGRYMPPQAPGYSIEMHPTRSSATSFPNGAAWTESSEAPRSSKAKEINATQVGGLRPRTFNPHSNQISKETSR